VKTARRLATHEDLARREETRLPSNRSFGLVFTAVFLVLGLLPLVGRHPLRAWAVAVSSAFLAVTFAAPSLLTPLNRHWMRFGLFLHRLISPVVLGIIFFGVITPMACALRLRKQDLLRLRFDSTTDTYWLKRDPPGPDPKSMAHQF
jgi:hypothetical protein